MKKYLFAVVLALALSAPASAQGQPAEAPVPPPPAVTYPNVYVPPGSPPGPAIPFHKGGGIVAGAYGYYPYDTGAWLLGGIEGTTRQSGSFTMVYPSAPAMPPIMSGYVPSSSCRGHGFKHGIFKR